MTYLLTWYGTVLCREHAQGALVHLPLASQGANADPLDVGDIDASVQASFANFLRDDAGALRFAFPNGPLAGWLARRSGDKRSLTLSRDGRYLVALAMDGAIDLTDAPGEQARFLPVSQADFTALQSMPRDAWLTGQSGAATQPAALEAGFNLRIGPLLTDLRWNLPFDLSDFPFRSTLLQDGWRIDQIHRYRPLVYYAAFGSAAYMRQFALSLRSLVTAGAYDGTIAVLTDKTAGEIRALLPPGMTASLVVLRLDAKDQAGYMAARYAIGTWHDAWAYQPLLYVDTDILFDRPVAPMLQAIARSDRIAAPTEPKEPLARSEFVGASLLRDDNRDPGARLGFNSGTIGIPNLRRHAATLDLVGRVLANLALLRDRNATPYFDQAVFNYVSFCLAKIDTALISPYVRLADARAAPPGAQGLVHFCWVPGADARVDVMERYLQALTARSGGA